MSGPIRSRRAGLSAEQAGRRPLYARVLGLQFLNPSGLLCFVFFEGMVALAVLLALAELVAWWAVLVLPAAVAAMVKINDVVAGALVATGSPRAGRRAAVAPPAEPEDIEPEGPRRDGDAAPWVLRQVSRDPAENMDAADSPRQRFRQSASRRYR